MTPETLEAAVEDFSRRIGDNDIPSDGLVLLYDDIAYGASLGRTAKSVSYTHLDVYKRQA